MQAICATKTFTPIEEVFLEVLYLEKEIQEKQAPVTRDTIAKLFGARYTKSRTMELISQLIGRGCFSSRAMPGGIPSIETTEDGRDSYRPHLARWEKQRGELLKKQRNV